LLVVDPRDWLPTFRRDRRNQTPGEVAATQGDPEMPLRRLTSSVGTVRPETTLREAAHIMCRDSIGTLLISNEVGGAVVGILTDRDIVREIGAGRDPDRSSVAVFTGQPVETMPEGASRREITSAMRAHGIRRIPLVDAAGKVTALVTFDDLMIETAAELFDLSRAVKIEADHEAPKPDASE
jgi:CBS domain-containing protein